MSYRPKTCTLPIEQFLDILEGDELVELEIGETLTSVKITGDQVVFTFDVKEE
jgi:hypothetical protein